MGEKDVTTFYLRCGEGNYLLGLNTPCFLKTSTTMGTVELTGFEMTSTKALGAAVAIPVARSRTMPALICENTLAPLRAGGKKRPDLEEIISDGGRMF